MNIKEAGAILWKYMHLAHKLRQVDAMLVMGSSDIGVAQRASEVFHAGYVRGVVCTGGLWKVTWDMLETTEAELFAAYMIEHDVPKDAIVLEPESTNSGDNILFWMRVLQESWYTTDTIIIVTKPYMQRRAYATAKAIFPDHEFLVTSQVASFDTYVVSWVSQEQIINLLVGDFQRIVDYPKKWFQIEQIRTDKQQEAFDYLVKAGYTKYLLK
jgi:uncharacterized SAM-binding protein YcdF (DUF218 family)